MRPSRSRVPATVLFALVLSCCALPCGAEPSSLRVLLEHIEVDAMPASQLLVKGEFDGLRASVAQLEGEGRARVQEIAYIRTRPQQRSRLFAVHELIYPTEWDPAELGIVRDADGAAVGKALPATPTAFEMRPVGAEFEISPGKKGQPLSVSSNLVGLHGQTEYGKGVARVTQPLFDSRNVLAGYSPQGGVAELIAAYTPRSEKRVGKTVFVFATATRTGGGVRKPEPLVENPFVEAAQDRPEGPEGPSMATISARMVEVGPDLFRKVLLGGDGTVGLVDRAIDDGAADLVTSSRLSLLNGRRSKVEDTHEFIYPTEFEPGGFGQLPEPPNIPPGALTAFEMRYVGATMEIDAILGVDGVTELNLAYEQVRFIRMVDYGHGEALAIQPVFETSSITTALSLMPGKEELVGAFTPRAEKDGSPRSGRIVLILARSDVAP